MEIQKFKDDATARLQNYGVCYCMKNLEPLRSKEEARIMQNLGKSEFESEQEQKKLIEIPKRYFNTEIDHIMCRQCANIISATNGKIKDNNQTFDIECKLCNTTHTINSRVWTLINKNKDGGCCIIF